MVAVEQEVLPLQLPPTMSALTPAGVLTLMICATNKPAEDCLSLLRLSLPEENPLGNECIESTGIKAAQTPVPPLPHLLAITRRLDPRIPCPTVLRPETPLSCPLPHHRGFNLFVKCLLSQDLLRQSQLQFRRLPARRQRPAALPNSLRVDRQVARKTDQQLKEEQPKEEQIARLQSRLTSRWPAWSLSALGRNRWNTFSTDCGRGVH